MKFIDLFAGIGGFHAGLEKAGHTCVGWVEWDKFARQSYQAIYDTDGLYTATDIQKVKGVDLPDADLWTFGSPCTDISLAGRKEGLKGKHSSMFFEIIRCLEERVQAQKELPAFLLMENVKALLSSNGGWDFARVLIEMDKVGYDCEWKVYNTADYLPQNRERVYIVGHLRKKNTAQIFSRPGQSSAADRQSQRKINIVGNVKKPTQTSRGDRYIVLGDGLAPTLLATNYKAPLKILIRKRTHKIVQIGNTSTSKSYGGNPTVGRTYSLGGIAPTLNTCNGGGRVPQIITDDLAIRRLTPRECWRLQGFSDDQFDRAKDAGLSDTQLYKQAGNAVSVPVVYDIGKRLHFA
ncbi:MAG: DNA cytosine methyltransferase [Lactobacillus delbrueckii subsp. lactis]|uniref:DNA (cytosine-5-)-methyltransferase n=1 Tax=Lactobacillus delbrueckii subsp. lactis TaxID=29397 RepID=A0A3G6JG70_LACDL|nr:MAG: DNA cytosine methyltransferase [Lactobacillus delbrueckii subsp. lactis]